MAFLDNSGDIILDAVLTDTGRFRLAKGDGSFKIAKFALADDEINYGLYNKNHVSGSAYYDLEILQSPVFEAFTNNTSTMNYKLLSIPRSNLLYLPIVKINNVARGIDSCGVHEGNEGYVVCVTNTTFLAANDNSGLRSRVGQWDGEIISSVTNKIRLDQGIDNSAISWTLDIDQDLKEEQYIIEIDSRLGAIVSPDDATVAAISFIDDDNIASYYISKTDAGNFVTDMTTDRGFRIPTAGASQDLPGNLTIAGAQGTSLRFRIASTLELRSSNYLFDKIGSTFTDATSSPWSFNAGTYKYIDAVVKVTGATTGYRLDLPVRFVKKTA